MPQTERSEFILEPTVVLALASAATVCGGLLGYAFALSARLSPAGLVAGATAFVFGLIVSLLLCRWLPSKSTLPGTSTVAEPGSADDVVGIGRPVRTSPRARRSHPASPPDWFLVPRDGADDADVAGGGHGTRGVACEVSTKVPRKEPASGDRLIFDLSPGDESLDGVSATKPAVDHSPTLESEEEAAPPSKATRPLLETLFAGTYIRVTIEHSNNPA